MWHARYEHLISSPFRTQWNVQLKPLVTLQWNLWSWILSPLLFTQRHSMKHSSDLRNKIGTVKWYGNHSCTYICTQVTFLPSWWGWRVVSDATVSKLRRFLTHVHVAQIPSYFLNISVWSKCLPLRKNSPIKTQWKTGTHVSWMTLNPRQWMRNCSR